VEKPQHHFSPVALCQTLIQEARAAGDNFDVPERALELGLDWYLTLKALANVRKRPIDANYADILSHQGWQRIIEHQLRTNPQCQKVARLYCRDTPFNGLISWNGNGFTILIKPTR
jgi:hypothetical protein